MDERATLVDLGAGTGQLSIAAARHCRRVVAVDVSPVTADVLREKLTAQRSGNVDVVSGGFLTYTHTGDAPKFVYSRYALNHLPDFWKAVALRRIRKLLPAGGVLRLWDVVYDIEPDDAEVRVEAWCAAIADPDTENGWNRWELEEHVRDEHSTFTWLLEPMIDRAGFAIEQRLCSDDGFDAQYVLRAI